MRERENNTFRRKKERKRNQNHEGENLGFIFKSGEGPLLGG